MCVIIVMEDKIPSLEVFKICEEKNSHGGGISWVENGKVHFKKGIKYKEMHKIAMSKGVPCVAHFRISTVGGTPPELCHPFPITKTTGEELTGSVDGVLFHNGHWKEWEDRCLEMILNRGAILPDGAWSDSRALAWLVACSNATFLIFTDQKVAIQTKTGVLRYGDWKEKDGVLYSNLHWGYHVQDGWNSKEGWNKNKNNPVGYGSYGGMVYGVDSKGKILTMDPEKAVDTSLMTEKEAEDHYTQMALEYEISKNGGIY